MNKLDEAVEQLRIKKAKQAYDLADLAVRFHRMEDEDRQKAYDDMVNLAKKIKAGA